MQDRVREEITPLLSRVHQSLSREKMLDVGDRVGVAVSAGADSVALLLLLIDLREKLALTLSVTHFNHKLRGRAADADEKFVSDLAAKYELPFHAGTADVNAIAKRDNANVEETARRARYAFFAQVAKEYNLNKIAVAHTADDQAETVLAHILRGTGITGLGGIHPQVGKVIRPLLQASRADLRLYLKSRGQSWREDATNSDTTKMRARIRKKLIPLLKKEFQPRVVEHLAALSGHARQDDALLERLAQECLESKLENLSGSARIRIPDLLGNNFEKQTPKEIDKPLCGQEIDAAAGLSNRLVRRIVGKVKGARVKLRSGELTALHVAQVLELARTGKTGMSLPLPGGVEVRRHGDLLIFCAVEINDRAARDYEYEIKSLQQSKTVRVLEAGYAVRFTVIDWLGKRGETSISGDVLNGDRLRFPLILRNWRPGDQFRAKGHTKAQKLKRLFNAKRIDRWERDGWPVIVSDGVLAWSRGFGPSAEFTANTETQTGIVIAEEKLS
jgi:tRNA(Ile)-lysidine synthase